MLIITGLGRCGTSVVAWFLQKIGYDLGNLPFDPHTNKIRAGMEFAPAYSINTIMYPHTEDIKDPLDMNKMTEYNYNGKKYHQTIKERILALDKNVIKDPRFTWHPRLIEEWYKLRSDLTLLLLHRNIEDILKSRKRLGEEMGGYTDPKRADQILLYKTDFADFYTKMLEIKIPHRVLFFPDFLTDYETVYEALCYLGYGFNKEKGHKVWEETIDVNLVSKFDE